MAVRFEIVNEDASKDTVLSAVLEIRRGNLYLRVSGYYVIGIDIDGTIHTESGAVEGGGKIVGRLNFEDLLDG